MGQPTGSPSAYEPMPLSDDERARAELAFVPYVTELLTTAIYLIG